MCNYRWSWEDCCSHRVCRKDVEVVEQNVFNARSQGVVCQYQRNPSFVFTHTFLERLLAGDGRHPFSSFLAYRNRGNWKLALTLIALHSFPFRIIHGHVPSELPDQDHYVIIDFTKATIDGAIFMQLLRQRLSNKT